MARLLGECVRNMKCTVRDLEVIGSNPCLAELWAHSSSIQVVLELPKYIHSWTFQSAQPYTTTIHFHQHSPPRMCTKNG